MTRLPKPKATYIRHQGLYLGSVYTAEQMRKFAEKAVLEEREALAQTEQYNFCPRCGKRNKDIHTCTPPQD